MNRDDIIRMAQEAGLHLATDVNWMPIIGLEYAEKFAALVAAAEREACIKLLSEDMFIYPESLKSKAAVEHCISAIRARGENGSLVVHPSDDDWYYANKFKANND